MKRTTPKQLATQAAKLDKQIQQATRDVESARRALESAREYWQELPARITDARAELIERDAEATAALAELTKPLSAYEYSARYYGRGKEGPRRYSSPKAQRAHDAERHAERARDHLAMLEEESAKGETGYMSEAIRALDDAESHLATLQGMTQNIQARAAEILGRELTRADLDALQAGENPAAPAVVTLPARDVTADNFEGKFPSYVVMADNLASSLGKVKAVTVGAAVYLSEHIRAWARLEKGEQITVTIGPAQVIFRSPTARMTLKSQDAPRGVTPAAVNFETV